MVLPDIESHIKRIEFVETISEWFLTALEIRTRLLRLRGVGQVSLQKLEEETLERRVTRAKKIEFIEDVYALSEGVLGTRDLNEASRLVSDLTTEPNCFPNAMKRYDALSRLIRNGLNITSITESSE